MDLTKAQTLCIHKLSKIIIVSKNKYLVFAPFLVVCLDFECFNNGQKFIIVSFISSFSWNYFILIVSYRVLLARVI